MQLQSLAFENYLLKSVIFYTNLLIFIHHNINQFYKKRNFCPSARRRRSTIMTRNCATNNNNDIDLVGCRQLLFATIALLAISNQLLYSVVDAVAPTIDYSHNMRILKLPKSTPVGELIYRLKGSDGDPSSRLSFGVAGIESRQLLEVVPVANSWNEADVYLKAPLEEPIYNLTIFVSDGTNKTTQVESTILVTQFDSNGEIIEHHHLEQTKQPSNDSHSEQFAPQLSPFVGPARHLFNVPENTNPGETIGTISVLESQSSDLPVRFELRGSGSDKFTIKYVFGPQGHSKGELMLTQQVDFEKQNLFSLKVLALNAWTNNKYDTRNVATMDIVIAIGDVQDTPPHFRRLPSSIRIVNTLQAGELVWRFEAEDGDFADSRPVQFALDAGSPLVSYFDIDKSSGELRMLRSARELAQNADWQSGLMLTVFASEVPDTRHGFDHLWPPMFARAELPLIMVEQFNEPPEFLGGWQTNETSSRLGQQRTLHGFLREPSFGGGGSDTDDDRAADDQPMQSALVQWYANATTAFGNNQQPTSAGRPVVMDLGLGLNGTFELHLDGQDAHLFQVEPQYPVSRQTTFNLFVKSSANRSLFDLDDITSETARLFQLDLVATDFGSPQRLSSKIKLAIELLDANDNAPQFDLDLYTFAVYENAQLGQLIGNIRARDLDRKGSRVKYTTLTGFGSQLFHLDQNSGSLTLEGQLDREKETHYLLVAEAQDQSGSSNYTKIMVNILDVNDNAPIFNQQHYDAILQADGTFQQPLIISAQDNDEPSSANSQIAYEIIAGNQNDQFAIDSLSGVIYPNNQQQARPTTIQIPSILNEPIVPFDSLPPRSRPDQAGKILPTSGGGGSGSSFVGHEVEETTSASRSFDRQQLSRPQQVRPKATVDDDQLQHHGRLLSSAELELPAGLELLMGSESSLASAAAASIEPLQTSSGGGGHHQTQPRKLPTSGLASTGNQPGTSFDPFKVAPLTTLVVRAHDFGIPLRSSTCKVNIYNQALQTRSVSLILNGTLEQLEPKRELIERSFGALTGARATIESLETLSDSSSICIAKIRLAMPQNSLVDLTDLGALMSAIGYTRHQQQTSGNNKDSLHQDQQQFRQPLTTVTHYITTGDRIYPAGALPHLSSSNLTGGGGAGGATQTTPTFYTDINSFALDSNAALERKLLIYIIIVGICILTLLVIWMIYSCSREDQHQQQVKIIDANKYNNANLLRQDRRAEQDDGQLVGIKSSKKQAATKEKSAIKQDRDIAIIQDHDGGRSTTHAKTPLESAIGNNLAKSAASSRAKLLSSQQYLDANLMTPTDTTTIASKRDHLSMYNGQVWFEPSGTGRDRFRSHLNTDNRRASSAPSGNSLDSALHATIGGGDGRTSAQLVPRRAVGQFFPNTIGYMENLASLGIGGQLQQRQQHPVYIDSRLLAATTGQSRRHRRRKVAPAPPTTIGMEHQIGGQVGATASKTLDRPRKGQVHGGHLNEAFEHDLEMGGGGATLTDDHYHEHRHRHHHHAGRRSHHRRHHHHDHDGASLSSTRSCDSSESQSEPIENESAVFLDSDQELLGFDSTGTPIIATHTRRSSTVVPATAALNNRLATGGSKSLLLEGLGSLGGASSAKSVQTTIERGVDEQKDRKVATGRLDESKTGKESEEKRVPAREDSEHRAEPTPEKKSVIAREKVSKDGGELSGGDEQEVGSENDERMKKTEQQDEDLESKQDSTQPVVATTTTIGQPESETKTKSDARQKSIDLPQITKLPTVHGTQEEQEDGQQKQDHSSSMAETAATTTTIRGRRPKIGQTRAMGMSSDDRQSASSGTSLPSIEGISSTTDRRLGQLRDMKNGELLEKQSIFAITYNQLATDHLPG